MHTTSALYQQLLSDGAEYETRIDLHGHNYHQDEIVGVPKATIELFGKENSMQIGLAASRQLTFTVLNRGDTIGYQDPVRVYVRLKKGSDVSEWIPKGLFYVNKQTYDEDEITLAINAVDEIGLLDDAEYTYTGSMKPKDILIASLNGTIVDPATESLIDNHPDPHFSSGEGAFIGFDPEEWTKRANIANISAACCGSGFINESGRFQIFSLYSTPAGNAYICPELPEKFKIKQVLSGITGVKLVNQNGNICFAGTHGGTQLSYASAMAHSAEETMGNQSSADYILAAVYALSLPAFSAKGVILDAAVEAGDKITIGGVTSYIMSQTIYFDAAMSCDIACPVYEDVQISQAGNHMKKALHGVKQELSEVAAGFPLRWETRQRIDGQYVINQSNYDSIEAAGTWEDNVLYFPIVGL